MQKRMQQHLSFIMKNNLNFCFMLVNPCSFVGLKQSCSALGTLTAVADEVDDDTQIDVVRNLLDRTDRLDT